MMGFVSVTMAGRFVTKSTGVVERVLAPEEVPEEDSKRRVKEVLLGILPPLVIAPVIFKCLF